MNWENILKRYNKDNPHPVVMRVFCRLSQPTEAATIISMIRQELERENQNRKDGNIRQSAGKGKAPQINYTQIQMSRFMNDLHNPVKINQYLKVQRRLGNMTQVHFGSNYQMSGWKWIGGPCE